MPRDELEVSYYTQHFPTLDPSEDYVSSMIGFSKTSLSELHLRGQYGALAATLRRGCRITTMPDALVIGQLLLQSDPSAAFMYIAGVLEIMVRNYSLLPNQSNVLLTHGGLVQTLLAQTGLKSGLRNLAESILHLPSVINASKLYKEVQYFSYFGSLSLLSDLCIFLAEGGAIPGLFSASLSDFVSPTHASGHCSNDNSASGTISSRPRKVRRHCSYDTCNVSALRAYLQSVVPAADRTPESYLQLRKLVRKALGPGAFGRKRKEGTQGSSSIGESVFFDAAKLEASMPILQSLTELLETLMSPSVALPRRLFRPLSTLSKAIYYAETLASAGAPDAAPVHALFARRAQRCSILYEDQYTSVRVPEDQSLHPYLFGPRFRLRLSGADVSTQFELLHTKGRGLADVARYCRADASPTTEPAKGSAKALGSSMKQHLTHERLTVSAGTIFLRRARFLAPEAHNGCTRRSTLCLTIHKKHFHSAKMNILDLPGISQLTTDYFYFLNRLMHVGSVATAQTLCRLLCECGLFSEAQAVRRTVKKALGSYAPYDVDYGLFIDEVRQSILNRALSSGGDENTLRPSIFAAFLDVLERDVTNSEVSINFISYALGFDFGHIAMSSCEGLRAHYRDVLFTPRSLAFLSQLLETSNVLALRSVHWALSLVRQAFEDFRQFGPSRAAPSAAVFLDLRLQGTFADKDSPTNFGVLVFVLLSVAVASLRRPLHTALHSRDPLLERLFLATGLEPVTFLFSYDRVFLQSFFPDALGVHVASFLVDLLLLFAETCTEVHTHCAASGAAGSLGACTDAERAFLDRMHTVHTQSRCADTRKYYAIVRKRLKTPVELPPAVQAFAAAHLAVFAR